MRGTLGQAGHVKKLYILIIILYYAITLNTQEQNMAGTKVEPELKRDSVIITMPRWLHDQLKKKCKAENRSKGLIIDEALLAHYGFERGE